MANITKQLEKLGFVFTQPEFCTKGDIQIVIDVYPYIFESKEKSFEFYRIKEIKPYLK